MAPSKRLRRLIVAIREGDEQRVEETILQFSRKRRIFAPLALAVGAFVMLFSGLRLLVTNWRLMLVQILPAMLIWAVTLDLKAHVLAGRQFHMIRGPIVLLVFAGVVLVTTVAFFLNAAFAFAISRPGPPQVAAGFQQAHDHPAVAWWGAGSGIGLAVAAVLAPRWGLGWFTVLLGTVLGIMMVFYVAVPARIVGVQMAKTADSALSGRDKLAAAAVSGAFGAVLCAPPYVISRTGIVLLDSHDLFGFGVALLVLGLILQAGVTGAVKAVKVSAKMLVGQSPHKRGDQQEAHPARLAAGRIPCPDEFPPMAPRIQPARPARRPAPAGRAERRRVRRRESETPRHLTAAGQFR
jgi:hypothetical protein